MDTQKYPNEIRSHYETHDCLNLPIAVRSYTHIQANADVAIKVEITNLHCKLCSYKNQDLDELIKHLIDSHDVDYDLNIPNCFLPFRLAGKPKCGICNLEFDLFEYLRRHADKEHLNKCFICEICGKSFLYEKYCSAHVRDFHKDGYECNYCDLVFSSNHKKILHERSAHEGKVYKCSMCDETLKSLYLKNVHLSEVHKVEERRIKCPHCPKVYPQINTMQQHVRRVHSKVKQPVYAVGQPMVNEKALYNTFHVHNPMEKTRVKDLELDYD
ncbi:zinc finger protein 600-like [Cydia fagiglandana]|uniref:zinc finger protein 600-like n=1 Tax=Cydia fagiglandana TaxID=1458189 RepID=UPI002FEE4D27